MLPTWCTQVCLCLSVLGAFSSPVMPWTEKKVAQADDVNVLMYGVLQLSESLHHVYQNTEAKLARITRAVTDTESLVQRLGQDTEQTIHSERQIKERLGVIQAETTALHTKAQQTKGLVYKVELKEVELKQKMTNLEETLKRFMPGRIRDLKETAQKHHILLHELVSWTEKQKQQLEHQSQQLAELQKQTNRSVKSSIPQSTSITSEQ